MALRARETLLVLAVAFGPYLVFDLLFQETITTRYALPLVIPVAYLAVRGASLLPRSFAVVAGLAIVASGAYVSDRAMYGFSTMEAPASRMLGDMHAASTPEGAAVPTIPVLAMHRREYFDMRRPFQWAGDRVPQFSQRLATPPKHEWLEVVKYWNSGGREPVWFIADRSAVTSRSSDTTVARSATVAVHTTVLLGGSASQRDGLASSSRRTGISARAGRSRRRPPATPPGPQGSRALVRYRGDPAPFAADDPHDRRS
jgi:hypothetical protein